MDLEIREFDPTTIVPDATILIVGKRHTGKTTLLRDIMYYMRDKLDLVIGMNPTEMGNHNLEFFTPKSFIFHEFNDDKLKHLLEWQKRAVANNKALRIGLIMDDCMAETTGTGTKKKKVMGSQDIIKVFKLGRHLKLFYINCMQYIKDAPPEIRGNVDLLFAFGTTSGNEREKLQREYFGQFSNYKNFCSVFEGCTQQYECIVLDTRIAARNLTDSVFYYKARVHKEPFRVGRPVFWKLSDYYFSDKSDYSMDVSKVLGSTSFGSDRGSRVLALDDTPRIVKKPRNEDSDNESEV
jgi:Cdc6-like AAA superfamily ATPase